MTTVLTHESPNFAKGLRAFNVSFTHPDMDDHEESIIVIARTALRAGELAESVKTDEAKIDSITARYLENPVGLIIDPELLRK